MSQEIRFAAEPIRSLAFGSIAAGYTGVGTRFDHAVRIFFVQNLTNVSLMFSFDGISDHFALPQNGYLLIDVTQNKTQDQGFYIAQDTRLYVKEIGNPTSGSVYLSLFYGVS